MKRMFVLFAAVAVLVAGCDDGKKKTEGSKMNSNEIKKNDPGMGAGDEAPPAKKNN